MEQYLHSIDILNRKPSPIFQILYHRIPIVELVNEILDFIEFGGGLLEKYKKYLGKYDSGLHHYPLDFPETEYLHPSMFHHYFYFRGRYDTPELFSLNYIQTYINAIRTYNNPSNLLMYDQCFAGEPNNHDIQKCYIINEFLTQEVCFTASYIPCNFHKLNMQGFAFFKSMSIEKPPDELYESYIQYNNYFWKRYRVNTHVFLYHSPKFQHSFTENDELIQLQNSNRVYIYECLNLISDFPGYASPRQAAHLINEYCNQHDLFNRNENKYFYNSTLEQLFGSTEATVDEHIKNIAKLFETNERDNYYDICISLMQW